MPSWPTQACHPAGTSLRLTTVHWPPCPPPSLGPFASFWLYPCQTSLEVWPRPVAWPRFSALTFSSPASRIDALHKRAQHQHTQGAHRKPVTPSGSTWGKSHPQGPHPLVPGGMAVLPFTPLLSLAFQVPTEDCSRKPPIPWLSTSLPSFGALPNCEHPRISLPLSSLPHPGL